MDDLLQPRRSPRRSLLCRLGAGFFAVVALAVAIDALRGGPLVVRGGQVASPAEAQVYRLSGVVLCSALAGWLLLAGRPRRREDEDSFLR